MTDPSVAELDYQVIIVRWDAENSRVVVDLGSVDTLSAHTMLCYAADAVYDEIDEPLVISDGNPEVEVPDDDDD